MTLYDILLDSVLREYRTVSHLEGDVVEFGTHKGNSASKLLALIPKSKTLHVCDSFVGMPEPHVYDNYCKKGDLGDTSAEEVRKRLDSISSEGDYKMHIGFVPPIPSSMEDIEKICFAYIDIDLYEAYHASLGFVLPRMVPGGLIVMDDYGAGTCEGATKAANEFVGANNLTLDLRHPFGASIKISNEMLT